MMNKLHHEAPPEIMSQKTLLYNGETSLDFRCKGAAQTQGFSLIEMIVVIAILAVLVIILAPALLTYTERSRAEKDNSAMDEVVNAVQLALADQEIYDEVLRFSTVDNISCYVDTNSEANYAKIVTKKNPDGIDQYTFTSDARQLDETPYYAAGNMRGVTITFAPDKGSNNSVFDLKQGIVNQYIQVNGNQRVGAMPKLYNRLRSSVGDTIQSDSQTYRNSEFTIFIRLGTIGGNDASAQDATSVYGQWSGTNLPAQVSYQLVTDRTVGDTGNTIVDINDSKWNDTNGSKLTLNPGDLNGGGSYSPNTSTGNQADNDDLKENEISLPTVPGLYDENGNIIVTWEDSKIDISKTYGSWNYNATYFYVPNNVLNNIYPDTKILVLPDGITTVGNYTFAKCSNLQKVVIPDTVTKIGDYSFWGTGLTSIDIPENITTIGMSAFNSTKIKSLKIVSNDLQIGAKAFHGCSELVDVELDANVTFVNDSTNQFSYCPNLKNVKIKTANMITDQMFSNCESLTMLNVPNGVTSIGELSFEKSGLISIEMPSSLMKIERLAFSDCSAFKEAFFPDIEGWSIIDHSRTEGSWNWKNSVDKSVLENRESAAAKLKNCSYMYYWIKE